MADSIDCALARTTVALKRTIANIEISLPPIIECLDRRAPEDGSYQSEILLEHWSAIKHIIKNRLEEAGIDRLDFEVKILAEFEAHLLLVLSDIMDMIRAEIDGLSRMKLISTSLCQNTEEMQLPRSSRN